MSNIYIYISLICLIVLNCFLFACESGQKEGFDIKKAIKVVENFNPIKMIDQALGKLIDNILGSIPILRDIHKKVKKEKGVIKKIHTTFYELFISLLTIIFTPAAALLVFFLAYNFMNFMFYNSHLLFQPWASLKDV